MSGMGISSPKPVILLAGCGKMGSALLSAWLKKNLVSRVIVIDPKPLPLELAEDARVTWLPAPPPSLDIAPDVLVLAVKPQQMKETTTALSGIITRKTVVLSIAAGQSLTTLSDSFSTGQPIIRTMPNTPAAIGKGITVAVRNDKVTADQTAICNNLLQAAGLVEWIADESLLDAVTALSGSGPAYLFLLIEVLTAAGKKIGLSDEMAQALARQTVIGSAALAEHDSATSAANLRQNVTSPGGTTQAALTVLMDGRLESLFIEALTAARNRSKELNA